MPSPHAHLQTKTNTPRCPASLYELFINRCLSVYLLSAHRQCTGRYCSSWIQVRVTSSPASCEDTLVRVKFPLQRDGKLRRRSEKNERRFYCRWLLSRRCAVFICSPQTGSESQFQRGFWTDEQRQRLRRWDNERIHAIYSLLMCDPKSYCCTDIYSYDFIS